MGRPRKKGNRNASGKLIPERVPANDRVIERRERFAMVQGGKAGDEIFDQIGRVWAVGLLENPGYDPAVLRDVGREYASLRQRWLPGGLGTRVNSYEPRSKAVEAVGDDPMGERFLRLDAMLRNAGWASLAAVRDLCLSNLPDEEGDCPWVARLVLCRLSEAPMRAADRKMLELAIDGLMAMAGR